LILDVARLFADQHQRRADRSLAENSLRADLPQVAAPAVFRFAVHGRKRTARRSRLRRRLSLCHAAPAISPGSRSAL
jgi:hypothetical protein